MYSFWVMTVRSSSIWNEGSTQLKVPTLDSYKEKTKQAIDSISHDLIDIVVLYM